MTDKLPDIRADVALIDMDGTVTPTIKHGDYCGRVLCQLVGLRHGMDEAGGESIVRQTFDLGEEPTRLKLQSSTAGAIQMHEVVDGGVVGIEGSAQHSDQ